MTEGDAQEVNRVLVLRSTPELVNQLLMRPNRTGMAEQQLQKVILGRRQSHRGFADKHRSAD
jgi:hypothetical protein